MTGIAVGFQSNPRSIKSMTEINKNQLIFRYPQHKMIHSTDFTEFHHSSLGYERYSMVELPDILIDTTVYVGNLNEFVDDEALSDLFKSVSTLQSVPSVICRKANYQSLKYGFVTFPTVEEKENAIIKFHGMKWKGKFIKVEPIKTGGPRCKVPEKLVVYTLGTKKNIKNSRNKDRSLRRVTKDKENGYDVVNDSSSSSCSASGNRNNGDGRNNKGKRRNRSGGGGSRSDAVFRSHLQLSTNDRNAFERAVERDGYVTLSSTGFRRGRKGSALGNIHRQWCDKQGKPQIIFCKATGGRSSDNVIVDLAPLRSNMITEKKLEHFFVKWKTEIMEAAQSNDMVLKPDYVEDNTETLDDATSSSFSLDPSVWATESIVDLPSISLGVFEGTRPNAKAMSKALAMLWDIKVEKTSNASNTSTKRLFQQQRKNNNSINNGKSSRKKKSTPLRETRTKRKNNRYRDESYGFYL